VAEYAGCAVSDKGEAVLFSAEHGAFAQSHNSHPGVDFQEFKDALFAGFPGMTFRVGVEVVGIDLEGEQGEGVEAQGVGDRHVVGSAQGRAGHVGTGAPPDEGGSCQYLLPDGLHEAQLVHLTHQLPGVATPHDDCSGFAHRCHGIFTTVYPHHVVPDF